MSFKRRPVAVVGSVGYQQLSHDQLIAWLAQLGIGNVADVRRTPFSFKRGWSKATLEQVLASHGIAYRSIRALGTPTELRSELSKTGDFAHFSARWQEEVLPTTSVQQALDEVWELAREDGVALLCLENDPAICHRTFLVNALAARAAGVQIHNYSVVAQTNR
jgi:uncharacterized protein (DUF488 family)